MSYPVDYRGTIEERIDRYSMPDLDTGCLLWMAGRNGRGYGAVKYKGRQWLAHRLAYTLKHGTIPEGIVCDHLCRVRHCVNPDHIELVTSVENTRRGNSGLYNRSKMHCPQGHEYNEENTRYKADGSRVCRTCANR